MELYRKKALILIRKECLYRHVCIRTSTERPEALDKGAFILAGITTEQVLQAVDTAVLMHENGDFGLDVPNYVDENVSTKGSEDYSKLYRSY